MNVTPALALLRTSTLPVGFAALLFCTAVPAAAQTAQSFSLQLSALHNTLFGNSLSSVEPGVGAEIQLRYTPSAISLGIGAQYTRHSVSGGADETVELVGVFAEPRYVFFIGSERIAPYASGRLSLSQLRSSEVSSTANGIAANGGGGLLIQAGSRANLDLGATVGYKTLGALETDFGTDDLGSGGNLVIRIGLAVGLGG